MGLDNPLHIAFLLVILLLLLRPAGLFAPWRGGSAERV